MFTENACWCWRLRYRMSWRKSLGDGVRKKENEKETRPQQVSCYRAGDEAGGIESHEKCKRYGSDFNIFVALRGATL